MKSAACWKDGSLSSSAEVEPRLGRAFFARPVVEVALDLLGCVLTSRGGDGGTAGRIVEVEAYGGAGDPASHAARLRHGRVGSMYGEPGFSYVYRSYGIHPMLNIVAETDGIAGAVLIRALEPIMGEDSMRRRRGVEETIRLCRGPGCLTVAMGITLEDHGLDLVSDPRIGVGRGPRPHAVVAGPRVGISKGIDRLWRFFQPDSPYVSAHRRGDRLAIVDGCVSIETARRLS